MRAALFPTSIAGALCLSTVLAFAQTAPSSKPQTVTTIIGCLVQSPTDLGRERRSDTDPQNASDFFLRTPSIAIPVGATITVGRPSTTPGSGGAGTTTSAGAPTGTAVYRITGLQPEQLRPHVGHRVELQGQLSGNMAPATNATSGTTATTSPGAAANTGAELAGVLNATAIKMITATCP